jgi:exosortase
MADPTSTAAITPAPSPGRVGRFTAAAAVVVALGWAYAADFRELIEGWSRNPDYSHGFLVIPVAALVLWRRWPRDEGGARPSPSAWGLVALAAVLLARAWLYERGEYWAATATIVPACAAVLLAWGGRPLLRSAWPAAAFLVFMLTVPRAVNSLVALPLQRLAATASTAVLRLTGLWVMTEGNVIVIGDDRLEVATACNGLSMLTSLAATVTAAVLLMTLPRWKRLVLLAGVIPVALSCNVARIAATAWCYHLLGSESGRKFAHDAAGWLMMPLALAVVGLGLCWLSWLVREEEVAAPAAPPLSARVASPTRRPAGA